MYIKCCVLISVDIITCTELMIMMCLDYIAIEEIRTNPPPTHTHLLAIHTHARTRHKIINSVWQFSHCHYIIELWLVHVHVQSP